MTYGRGRRNGGYSGDGGHGPDGGGPDDHSGIRIPPFISISRPKPTVTTFEDQPRSDVIVTHTRTPPRVVPGRTNYSPPPGGTTPSVLPRSFDTNLGRPAAMRTLTVNGSQATIPVVYGQQKVGGNVVFVQESGGNLYVVFLLCEGPIQEVSKIWIDNKRIDFAAGTVGLGLTLNTDYFVYLGTAAQTVNTMIQGVNANWVSGLPGTAYVAVKFPAPTSTTGSYDPLRFIAEIKGKKVVDPRVNLSTFAYSENPVLHLFNLLTNPTYGAGFPTGFMDSGTTGSWATAANDCDSTLSRPTAPGTAPTKASDTGGSGVIDGGNYAYTLTFTDASGVESLESANSTTINSPTGQAMVINIITGPGGTTARTLYRTHVQDFAAGARYLVKKIANNSATTTTDNIPDAQLGVRAPQSAARYSMGLMLRDAAPMQQWVEMIRAHFLGYLSYDGQYKVNIDKAKSSSGIAFTESNIVGIPTIRSKGAAEVPTKVVVTFTDQQNDYADGTAEKELDTVSTRVDERRVLPLALPGILSFDQAARIALQHLNVSTLRDKEIEWYATPEGVQPLPGDVVEVTHSGVGLSSAEVLLLGCEPTNDGMRWKLNGEFYDAAVYSDTIQNNPTPISPFLTPHLFSPGVTTVNTIVGDVTLSAGTNITLTPAGSVITIASTGGSSALTVEEADGSPTDAAVTKIVFPNGSLGIASHVATYTPVADATKADKSLGLTASEGVQRVSGTDHSTAIALKMDVNGLTTKTTPVGADLVPIWDVAGAVHKKATLLSLPFANTTRTADASPPGSPAVGDVNFTTDSARIRRWSGTQWDSYGPIFPLVDNFPTFTWRNQGTASVSTANGGIEMSVPNVNGYSFRGQEINIPAAPFGIAISMLTMFPIGGTFATFGLYISDGTKLIAFGYPFQTSAPVFIGSEFTNVTTPAGVTLFNPGLLQVAAGWANAGPAYIRFRDDNTTWFYELSFDGGKHYYVLFSHARNTFLTATKIGWGGYYNTPTAGTGFGRLTTWTQS